MDVDVRGEQALALMSAVPCSGTDEGEMPLSPNLIPCYLTAVGGVVMRVGILAKSLTSCNTLDPAPCLGSGVGLVLIAGGRVEVCVWGLVGGLPVNRPKGVGESLG